MMTRASRTTSASVEHLPLAQRGRHLKRKASLPLNSELMTRLKSFSSGDLKERQNKIEALSIEQGVRFQLDEAKNNTSQDWQLDILPFVIPPDEWKNLEAGLIQRMRAFDLFLADIYSEQRILKERILPYELIFQDPAFLRQCIDGDRLSRKDKHLLLGAVDLVRTQEGQWLATQHHCSTPFGLSYVIQHRRILNQAFPELFESMNVQPVFSFSTELVEALSSLSDKPSPHIVLLNQGNFTENDFEESFLARRMGIAVVNPVDLIVREGNVYLKTINGLEQVDVIYRRMVSRKLDPIAFGPTGVLGIPGLVNCARKGSVIVANSIGSGIADNKALLRYTDQIISYYLGEQALLKTVDTYACGDLDQRDYVRMNKSTMLLKPIHREGELSQLFRADQRAEYQKKLKTIFEETPERVVAQPFINASTAPRYDRGRLVPLPVYLRAFVLLGANPMVLPGGLTRQALPSDSHYYIADLAAGAKDTWVPTTQVKQVRRVKKKTAIDQSSSRKKTKVFHIASSVAESIFWIGRYVERTENTARMIRIMEEYGWTQLGRDQKMNLWPLWQGVAAATGHENFFSSVNPPRQVRNLSLTLVLQKEDPSSIPHCIQQAHQNAREIREYITPEVWSVMNRLHASMSELPEIKSATSAEMQDVCLKIIDDIAGFNGTLHRTMPNDETWEFYQLGFLIERATGTVRLLDKVLATALVNLEPGKQADPDLTILLRLLGSLDAYQREFRSRTHPGQVAELLWKHLVTPSSVAFCTKQIRFSLANILESSSSSAHTNSAYQSAEALLSHLASIRTDMLFPATAFDEDVLMPVRKASLQQMIKRVSREGLRIERSLFKINEQIEDSFFSHQAQAFEAGKL